MGEPTLSSSHLRTSSDKLYAAAALVKIGVPNAFIPHIETDLMLLAWCGVPDNKYCQRSQTNMWILQVPAASCSSLTCGE